MRATPGANPCGFGFRTGVRSARVAIGFAVYALTLGTILVVIGAAVFIGAGQWPLLGLMVLIEVAFVLAFRTAGRAGTAAPLTCAHDAGIPPACRRARTPRPWARASPCF